MKLRESSTNHHHLQLLNMNTPQHETVLGIVGTNEDRRRRRAIFRVGTAIQRTNRTGSLKPSLWPTWRTHLSQGRMSFTISTGMFFLILTILTYAAAQGSCEGGAWLLKARCETCSRAHALKSRSRSLQLYNLDFALRTLGSSGAAIHSAHVLTSGILALRDLYGFNTAALFPMDNNVKIYRGELALLIICRKRNYFQNRKCDITPLRAALCLFLYINCPSRFHRFAQCAGRLCERLPRRRLHD